MTTTEKVLLQKKHTKLLIIDLNGQFGPLRSFADLIPELKKRNVDCCFLVPRSRALELGNYIFQSKLLTFDDRNRFVAIISLFLKVRRLRSTYDLIHANSTSATRWVSPAIKFYRLSLVSHLRNSKLSEPERIFLKRLAKKPRVRFVSVSNLALAVSGIKSNKVSVIPDPVSIASTQTMGEKELPHRANYDRPINIGLVANQQPTKGFDIAVDVALLTKDRNIIFHVFGSAGELVRENSYIYGQILRIHEAELLDRFIFHQTVPRLDPYFGILDVFFLTSRRESFSRVTAEVVLAGLPLIAPDLPAVKATLGPGSPVILYETENAQNAAIKLLGVLDNLSQHTLEAWEFRTKGEARYSPEVAATELYALYCSMMK